MAIGLQNYPNIDGADADYPNGKIRDRDGSTQGTPVNELVYGDHHQFFAKLLRVANITPNELPDSEYNLHQYYDALLKAVNYDALSYVVRSLTNYTTNDVLILWGCTLTINLPGTCSITDGAIYYNGIVYNVDAMSVSVSNPNTCVFQIDTTVVPNKIIIAQGPSGTGIADAGSPFAGSVKYVSQAYRTDFTYSNSWSSLGFIIRSGILYFAGSGLSKVLPTGTTQNISSQQVATLPVWARPSRNWFFSCAIRQAGVLTNNIAEIQIESTGIVRISVKDLVIDASDGNTTVRTSNISFPLE